MEISFGWQEQLTVCSLLYFQLYAAGDSYAGDSGPGIFLVQRQTKELIAPINELDLEHPLKDVRYEELRPLLVRVDQQNKQIASQLEELKEAEAMRREFSANVSHELKTPLMSISGYAELMMNGMVGEDKVPEFSGRIYHEASRLSSLVSDIIQLSRLDEKNSDMPFEAVDIYELAEDIVYHLQPSAEKSRSVLFWKGSMWRCEESGRFFMKCSIILRTMPSAIPMQEELSGCLQGRKDIIHAICGG